MTARRRAPIPHRPLHSHGGGEPSDYADLSEFSRGEANDMCVDAEGRAWVDSFGYDLYAGEQATGATLMRVDPDGRRCVLFEAS